MSEIDDILNAFGVSTNTPRALSTEVLQEHPVLPSVADIIATAVPEEEAISDADITNLLAESGIAPMEDADAEELNTTASVSSVDSDPVFPLDTTRLRSLTAIEEELNTTWRDTQDFDVVASSADTAISTQVSTDTTATQDTVSSDPAAIPLNSPTLLVDDSTSRFSGTEWYNEIRKKSIILAGLGGIGSNVAFQIARMAPEKMVLYDDDRVDTSNMSGQMFAHSDVGKYKTDAVSTLIHNYTSTENVFAVPERFTSHTESGDIMICGFDNMEARKLFFYAWKQHIDKKPEEEKKNCLFIDGRLSIDTLQVFCISGDDDYSIKRYECDYLFSDAEADATICSLKQTTYLACMIGSLMVNVFTNWVANSLNPILPYDLPFFIEYDAQNMIFKTER